ncbi:phage tail protein [Paenibacillus sp. IHBB 10380]|uniref:phage tail protein n=1 Tax=Paenibacillus sp. IHBB 10380 TaxID=1566358 RepID=UPI0005CFCB1F|nr:phage tail protein [Paenibacillus sp. IHBB 10380]AJS59844.1 hypothetical protein UB51_16685 [Paenibacillus sp. IHBB 10380]
MSSNTPNLDLLKMDPITDGNDTFNIKTMMNDNWDKIDEAMGNIDVDIPEASLTQKGIVQLSNATNGTRETLAPTEKALGLVMLEAQAGKQAGNERKAEVVAALVAVGIPATTSETWAQLITKMATVIKATGNATAADVLVGKTASNQNGPLTGTMPNRSGTINGTLTSNASTKRIEVNPPAGYYPGNNKVGNIVPTLLPENIKKGVTIIDLVGTYDPGAVTRSSTTIPGQSRITFSPGEWGMISFEFTFEFEPERIAQAFVKKGEINGGVGTGTFLYSPFNNLAVVSLIEGDSNSLSVTNSSVASSTMYYMSAKK